MYLVLCLCSLNEVSFSLVNCSAGTLYNSDKGFFVTILLLTYTSLSPTLMYLSRQTIYSDCAPYAAGILHLMRCAQWQLRRNSISKINWTNCPFSTYIIVVGIFQHKLSKGCTPPLLTKYTGDSWVMELLRHKK